MIETVVTGVLSIVLGVAGGMTAANGRTHSKLNDMDRRIDQIELRVAEKYVPRTELAVALQKMEDHMIRIENKLDQMALRNG
jgi:hypothetical protein